MNIKGGGSLVLRAFSKHDRPNFVVEYLTEQVSLQPGVESTAAVWDAIFNIRTASTYYTRGRVIVSGAVSPVLESQLVGVGTLSADGHVDRVGDGGKGHIVVKDGKAAIALAVDLTEKPAMGEVYEYVSATPNCLAEHCAAQIDGLIDDGMSEENNGFIFSVQNHASATYQRNADCWAHGIDLTCCSPWNSMDGPRRAGTLVTPRHIVTAAHYELNVGVDVRFVTNDNITRTRRIVGKRRHPAYAVWYPDFTIYTLDSDLPDLQPCQVMPSDWNDYLRNNKYNEPPVLQLDQEEKAIIANLYNGSSAFSGAWSPWRPTFTTRAIFGEGLGGGDSGNPAFLVVNGSLVLLTVFTGGGSGSGTPVAEFIPDLNQMIIDADTQAGVTGPVADPTWPNANGHYQLKPADFSAFPNYA